jgi:Patatin-like phospholipase
VDDAIQKYKTLSEKVFTTKTKNPKATFDHKVLEQEIKRVVATAVGGQSPSIQFKDSRPDLCRTFVVATSLHAGGSVRMRSYGTRDNYPFPACIWQVGRATSAAPTFFAPIEIDDELYGDGGTGWNNPTKEAISEVGNIWPDRPVGIIISIGTGLENPLELKDEPDQLSSYARFLLKKTSPRNVFKLAVAEYTVRCLTSCEMTHREIADRPDRHVLQGNYFRLNVPQGMGAIGLAEWDKLKQMISLTNRYMEHGERRELKRKMANLLRHPERISRSLRISSC